MGSAVLDTAIGLGFVFFVLSLVCSGVAESLANALNKRASFLLRGLRQLLDGKLDKKLERQSLLRTSAPGTDAAATAASITLRDAAKGTSPDPLPLPTGGLAEAVLGHPLVQALKRPSWWRPGAVHNPSYLPAATASRVLLDMLLPQEGSSTTTGLTTAVGRLPQDLPGRAALMALARDAGNDVDRLRANIEQWYDDQMRQVSGWYRQWVKKWLIALALAVTVVANVDALAIGFSLYRDQPVRDVVVAQALAADSCPTDEGHQQCIDRQRETLQNLDLPIGWAEANRPHGWSEWAWRILGWLITAGAASLGAPFWFDALSRLGSWRNTGPKPAATGSA